MGRQTDLAFAKEDELIPPALRLVRDFVNTVEYQEDDERLRTPDALRAWLRDRAGLPASARVTPEHLAFARTIREGFRAVLESHAGHDPDVAALRELDDALRDLPMRVAFGDRADLALVPATADPVHAALGRVLDAVRAANEDGSWPRLKACARSSCRWAYYDSSRNRSSRWCTMAGCGNAVKMQKAYAARKARASTSV